MSDTVRTQQEIAPCGFTTTATKSRCSSPKKRLGGFFAPYDCLNAKESAV